MKTTKNNRLILLEAANPKFSSITKRYKNTYVYSGHLRGAENIPGDFLDATDYYTSDYKAGKIIDWVYSQYIKGAEIEVLNKIIDNERNFLIIKKTILQALVKLFTSFMLAAKFVEKYKIEEEIDFVPFGFSYILYQIIVQKEGLVPSKINIPSWYLKKMKRREFIKNIIYRVAFFIYPLTLCLFMKAGMPKNIHKKYYPYGVYIWDTAFDKPPYEMNFLESEDGVNPDNTLYIMDRGMSRANIQKIKTNRYCSCYFKEMIRQFSLCSYFTKIYPRAKTIAKKMASINSDKILLVESYLKTLRWYIFWEIFYSCYDIDTFIAVQEPGNVARVLLQKMHGSRNIFVYMSTQFDVLYRKDMDTFVEVYYGFLIYDAMISSTMSNNYFKKNNNFIERYISCGILRSDTVFNIRHNSRLRIEIKKELGIPLHKTIIGFFDAGVGERSFINIQEGIRTVNDIYNLLESNDEYYIIFQSRNAHKLSGISDFKKQVERLISHKRVFYINESAFRYDGYTIMGICDLVIGVFSSSVPQESVAGGVRTICYVPSERFNKDIFEITTFPHFSAYGYKQLNEYTKYWLNECSEDEFCSFQDTYIKKYVDTYCDGQAAKRLHLILQQYNGLACEHIAYNKFEEKDRSLNVAAASL